MSKSQPVTITISKAFGLFGKLLRTHEDEGVTMAHWQKPINDIRARRNHAEYLKMGCPKVNPDGTVTQPTLLEGEDFARLILGVDLITPEDIETKTGIRYTDEQKAHAAKTMPTSLETLQAIKADGMMMVFGPSEDSTIINVRDFEGFSQLFYSKTGGWYAKDKEKFSRTDKVRGGQWLIIRKTPVDGSTSKNWSEQSAMIKSGDRVPNVAEMSYAVTLYYQVRNMYLLGNVVVRTSSVDAGGLRVIVGDFDSVGLGVGSNGLDVDGYWDHDRHSFIGVASARE